MPRLSQADAELVLRCLERALEGGGVDSLGEMGTQPVAQVLARLRTRVEQGRVAASLPREGRRQRRAAEAAPSSPRRGGITKEATRP